MYSLNTISPKKLDVIYKEVFQLDCSYGLEKTYQKATRIIYSWIRNKFAKALNNRLPLEIQTIELEEFSTSIGILSEPDQCFFSFRSSHPDSEVAQRTWITETSIIRKNEILLVKITNSCSSPRGCTTEVKYSVPRYVSFLSEQIGLFDVKKVERQPIEIETDGDVEKLKKLVFDPYRRLPVILVSQVDRRNWQYPFSYTPYLIDMQRLSSKLCLRSHIFYMSVDVAYKWTNEVSKKWSVFDGAVRVYYPKADIENGNPYEHYLATQDRIFSSYLIKPTGEELMGEQAFLEKLIFRINTREGFNEGINREFAEESYAQALRRRNAELRERKDQTREERIRSIEVDNTSLKKEIEELKSLANSYADDADQFREELEETRRIFHATQACNEVLTARLRDRADYSQTIEYPSSYDEIEEWVNNLFAGRIFMHNKAVKALEDSNYSDVTLLCRAIELLATSYHDMRKQIIDSNEFNRKCQEIGVEEAASISDVGAGRHQEEYFCRYNGKKMMMDRHLKKGSSRDPQYCLRIYFFWDDENSIIVIGHLPTHLTISST